MQKSNYLSSSQMNISKGFIRTLQDLGSNNLVRSQANLLVVYIYLSYEGQLKYILSDGEERVHAILVGNGSLDLAKHIKMSSCIKITEYYFQNPTPSCTLRLLRICKAEVMETLPKFFYSNIPPPFFDSNIPPPFFESNIPPPFFDSNIPCFDSNIPPPCFYSKFLQPYSNLIDSQDTKDEEICALNLNTFKVMLDESKRESSAFHEIGLYYINIMENFKQTQIYLLQEDLITNTKKGDHEHMHHVVNNFILAYNFITESVPSLSVTTIITIHTLLGKNGNIIPNFGKIRNENFKKNVHCGDEHFLPYEEVNSALFKFVMILNELIRNDNIKLERKVSWCIVNFLQIHPFSDGNGRTSRILAYWILNSCGFPFPITMCGSDRPKYIEAVRSIRGESMLNLSRIDFNPKVMTSFITERILKSWLIFENLLKETKCLNIQSKSRLVGGGDGDREKEPALVVPQTPEFKLQRAKDCAICLSAQCDVTVLCCNTPMHFHCLRRWLASTVAAIGSCPCCRGSIAGTGTESQPAPVRGGGRRHQERDDEDDEDSSYDSDDDDEDTTESYTSFFSDETTETSELGETLEAPVAAPQPAPASRPVAAPRPVNGSCRNCQHRQLATQCPFSLCGACCLGLAAQREPCARHRCPPARVGRR